LEHSIHTVAAEKLSLVWYAIRGSHQYREYDFSAATRKIHLSENNMSLCKKTVQRYVSTGSTWDATIWDSTNKKWSRILSTWNKQQWSRSLVVWSNNGAVTYSLKRKKKFKISTTDSVQLQTTAVEPILENSVVDYHNRIWDWTVCGMHIE